MNSSPNVLPRRRQFLSGCAKGAAATLALPWLGSLPVRSQETGKQGLAEAESAGPPIRFGCIYFSNGVEPAHWWAKPQGKQLELGPGMKPLKDKSSEIVFIKGLFNEQAALHPSPHMGRMANLLSGAWVSNEQAEIRVGKSLGQVLAQDIGKQTPRPSPGVGVAPK